MLVCGFDSFVLKEPALAMQASSVASKRAIGADDAMAGDDDADGVGAIGQAHGADGGGLADPAGQLGVADGGAARNTAEDAPDRFLKRSAGGADGKGVDGVQLTREVSGDAIGEAARIALGDQLDAGGRVVTGEEVANLGFAVGPERGAEGAGLIGGEVKISDRRRKMVECEGKGSPEHCQYYELLQSGLVPVDKGVRTGSSRTLSTQRRQAQALLHSAFFVRSGEEDLEEALEEA